MREKQGTARSDKERLYANYIVFEDVVEARLFSQCSVSAALKAQAGRGDDR